LQAAQAWLVPPFTVMTSHQVHEGKF